MHHCVPSPSRRPFPYSLRCPLHLPAQNPPGTKRRSAFSATSTISPMKIGQNDSFRYSRVSCGVEDLLITSYLTLLELEE